MSNMFEFVAEKRALSGKKAARAERRNGNIPAIVYGGKSAPQAIVLEHNKVIKYLEHEAVYSHVLDLKIAGKTEKAILRDIQRHPAKAKILHMDFVRIDATHTLKVRVPLHFINEDICVGAKLGGVITHAMVDVEVACLPSDLPEFIEVDIEKLDLGDSVHLSNLILPKGVEIPVLAQGDVYDHTVASVMKFKGTAEDEEEDEKSEDNEEDTDESSEPVEE